MKDKQQITDVGVNWTTMAQFNLTWVNKIAANGKEITLMAATTGGTSCTIASEIVVLGLGGGGVMRNTDHRRLKMRAWLADSTPPAGPQRPGASKYSPDVSTHIDRFAPFQHDSFDNGDGAASKLPPETRREVWKEGRGGFCVPRTSQMDSDDGSLEGERERERRAHGPQI